MGAAENEALLRDIFRELSAGNGQPLVRAMREDFRWIFPGTWSWAGVWEPRQVVLEGLLRPLMAQFRGDYRCEADLIITAGDRVVVQAHAHATTLDGHEYPQTYCYVFEVQDGRLTQVVEHCDTALVERVLTPLRP